MAIVAPGVDPMTKALKVAASAKAKRAAAKSAAKAAAKRKVQFEEPAMEKRIRASEAKAEKAPTPVKAHVVPPKETPPKVTGCKFPKVVARLHALIGEEAKTLTPPALRKHVGAGWNNFTNSFRNNLSEQHREQYSKASKADQESWVTQWAIDPEQCKNHGFNRDYGFEQHASIKDTHWVILSVLGGPKMLSNMEMATKLANSGELPSRPCKFKTLAAEGVLEYQVTDEMQQIIDGTRRKAGVSSKADMTTDEAKETKADIVATSAQVAEGLGSRRPSRKPSTVKVEVPGLKELKVENGKKESALRALKRRIDAITVDLNRTTDLSQNMVVRGYPQSLAEFYASEINGVKAVVAAVQKAYGNHVFVPAAAKPAERDNVTAATAEIDAERSSLEEKKGTFDKKLGSDLRKIAQGSK